MKIFVIMGNDYPDAVRASEEAAQEYVDEQNAESKKKHGPLDSRRVYWRYYDFELPATTMSGRDAVVFPKTREAQVSDLQALAGDALLRGDRMAWAALMRAAEELKHLPEFDSQEGKLMSADMAAMLGKVTRQ